MKLYELVVGREYAVHRHYVLDAYWARGNGPAQAKLLRIDLRQNHSHRHYRVCVFELLQDGPWQTYGPDAVSDVKGTVIELEPRFVWRPWSEQAQINAEKAETEKAINANAGLARNALGRLGLHSSRGMTPSTFATDFEVTLSVFELVKLADRADHLVELERLMLSWRANVIGDGAPAPDRQFLISFEAKLLQWAREHDFETLLEDMRRDRELQLGAAKDTPPRQL